MINTPFEKIMDLLKRNACKYQLVEHEPVFTSEEAAKIRGFTSSQGAKSLVVKAGEEFLLVVIPGSERLDSKKLKEKLAVKQLRFANPDEVLQIMGVTIGACYPFGEIAGLRMLVDKKLTKNDWIGFSPGVHDKSIKMLYTDYEKITSPKLVDVTL